MEAATFQEISEIRLPNRLLDTEASDPCAYRFRWYIHCVSITLEDVST